MNADRSKSLSRACGATAQEERFSRKKHDARFPAHAIDYCLAEGGIGPGGVSHVVFYDKPFLKFERLVETYLTFASREVLAVGNCLLRKEQQDPALKLDYKTAFELD